MMMILMPKSEPIVSFTSYECHDIFPCRTEEKPVVVKKPMPWNKAINKTRVINMLQGPIPAPTFEKIDMLGIKNEEEDKRDPLDPESLLGPKKKYKPQKEDVVKTNDTEVVIVIIHIC